MRSADRILDLGPGAGEHGGNLVAAGNFEEIRLNHASLTGRFLNGDLEIQVPQTRRQPGRLQLKIFGAVGHNLKGFDLDNSARHDRRHYRRLRLGKINPGA